MNAEAWGGRRLAALALVLSLVVPALSQAHRASDALLQLDLRTPTPQLRLALRLTDLEVALGLDTNGDGAITRGELRSARTGIDRFALDGLSLRRGGRPCQPRAPQHSLTYPAGAPHVELAIAYDCRTQGSVALAYGLLFAIDPLHRGLLGVRTSRGESSHVLSPATSRVQIDGDGIWAPFASFWREGVHHIGIGIDHLLFLVTLLLPAVLRRDGRHWRGVETLRPALLAVAAVVTAFTVAHSMTLSVAVLCDIALPGRLVESAIAISVLAAALNNVLRLSAAPPWQIAFALGLVHGFGFAGVLADLELGPHALAVALLGFNLGVETGQLAFAALVAPTLFLLRNTRFYRRTVVPTGSAVVATVAVLWLLERGFDAGPFST